MARGNKYTCVVCGKVTDFCPSCAVDQPDFEIERYCCAEHAKIFDILSKNGCGILSAEETFAELKDFNINGLSEDIQAHINSLQPKKAEVEARPVKASEEEPKKRHPFRA